jgi:hypothetical protein
MFPLLENVSLDADQSIAATRLLLRIAHVDGAKTAEEVALIRWFHDSGATPASTGRLSRACKSRTGR